MRFFLKIPFQREIKRLLPQGLFGRSLLILIMPLLIVQGITAYIFVDRHLDKVTQLLAGDIAGKVSSAVGRVMSLSISGEPFSVIQEQVWENDELRLALSFSQRRYPKNAQRLPYRGKLFYKALTDRLSYPFRIMTEKEELLIEVETPRGFLTFKEQLKHLYPKTTALVLWWITLAPLLFLLIAVLFLKNQIRPLSRLSQVVEEFGRGQDTPDLKLAGSLEVRKVTYAFNLMKGRIKRQIAQRTEMLAGISHDLKTPLTRMELQVTLMGSSAEATSLHEDIQEMNRMLEAFLAFAKGEEAEKAEIHNLSELIRAVAMKHDFSRIALSLPEETIFLSYRQNSLTRCFSNLIGNALKYASHLEISLKLRPKGVEIYFDDDGPGIPEGQREEVFRPFFRLEQSRNQETGGVGLGLSIAQDIVHAHGGIIRLRTSPLGGLRVIMRLPR